MKNSKRDKREHGAVALISVIAMTVFILLTAMVIDFGLFNYKSTKLQNAVDSAATAVASNLDATPASQEQTARYYLTKNGFDGSSDKFTIDIEVKGVLDEETATSEDDYITAGYLKLTVSTKEGLMFAGILGSDSMYLKSTSYVKCDATTVNFPRNLKYTLFAGSTNSTAGNAAMQINGRTGDVTNYLTSKFEGFINGVNESIVQPLVNYFGGTANYTDVVHFNLSEVMTNGDLHSNSDISVGVQALNVSRTKDGNLKTVKTDSNGDPVYKTDANGNILYDSDGNPLYQYVAEENNTTEEDADSYGQVTFQSVGDISFTNTSDDGSTHVYVQNQQCTEQTQVTLNVLNNIDFSNVTSTASLQSAYQEAVEYYIASETSLTDEQAEAIRAQVDNLSYDSDSKTVNLDNQTAIVYDVSQSTAESSLASTYSSTTPLNPLLAELINNGNDPVYADDGTTLLYQYTADDKDTIECTAEVADGISVIITGTTANRDLAKTGVSIGSTTNATATGAKLALALTFREQLGDDGYVTTVNMKPYFVRAINKSIRNATKSAEDLGNSEVTGDKTVKLAVASMTNDLNTILDNTEYTDDTYSNTSTLTNADTSPLFTYSKADADSGLTELTGTEHTTYKGFSLYDSNNVLKAPSTFVSEYKAESIDDAIIGKKAVQQYYDDNIKSSNENYETSYSADAVAAKRASIEASNSLSTGYDNKTSVVTTQKFSKVAPSVTDVFLGTTNSVRKVFDNAVSDIDGVTITLKYLPTYAGTVVTMRSDMPWGDGSTGGTKTCTSTTVNNTNGTSGSSSVITASTNAISTSDVYVKNKNLDVKENATLVVTKNINIAGSSSGNLEVRDGAVVYVFGDVTCNNLVMYGTGRLYCAGTLTIKSSITTTTDSVIVADTITFSGGTNSEFANNGIIMTTSNFTCASYLTNNGTIKCMGDFTINGVVRSGTVGFYKYYYSVYANDGSQLYVKGNVSTAYGLVLSNSIMYVVGNVYVASIGTSSNMLELQAGNTVYIRGTAYCGNSSAHVYLTAITSGTGSLLSIYGNGTSNDCFASTIAEFCNKQEGSTVYLGSGTILSDSITGYTNSKYNLYISGSSNEFVNYGTLYVYGNMQLNATTVTLSGSGKTYIAGNVYASNATISVTNGHTYVADGWTNCKYATASTTDSSYNKSCLWAIGGLRVSGGITVESASDSQLSEVYGGSTNSSISAGAELIINGRVYLPSSITIGELNKLSIGSYGLFIHNGDSLTVKWFLVEEGGLMYTNGKLVLDGCRITNNGKLYIMGGVDMTNGETKSTTTDIVLGDNSDTFIGSNTSGSIGDLSYKGFYQGRGNIYIENNLTVNGYNTSSYISNRDTAVEQLSGNTYVSGNIVVTSNDNGTYTAENTSISCQNFTTYSAIYNLGKLIILDKLDFINTGKYSDGADKSLKAGFSIRNGGTQNNKIQSAVLYIGSSDELVLGGALQNWGQIYSNGGVNIQGYYESSSYSSNVAYLGQEYSISHFGGDFKTNSNAFYNGEYATFSNEGDLDFGICLFNCGTVNVTGSIYQNGSTVNSASWRSSKSMSVMNGFCQVSKNPTVYEDAVLYCGGSLTLGSSESGGEAGSFFNMATVYVTEDLNVYCNKGNSYYVTAIWAYENSNTFVGGDCFGGGGVATGNNSIFMVGGDYRSKRSTKINVCFFTYNTIDAGDFFSYKDVDNFSSCYFYVGGNMLSNTLGKTVKASALPTTKIPENNSRDLDIYSNSNIYIGGSLYANSKMYLKQNVTMVIAGEKSLYKENGKTVDEITTQSLTLYGDQYALYIAQCLDENICSRIICNGSVFVSDTTKIRDMTKNWFNGNFKCNDYVEIGKSLYDDSRDESQAVETTYRAKGESKVDYVFSNAGYTYVGGDFTSLKYNKIYASTTLRVAGDYVSGSYLTLRHDAKIYVGKKLKATTSIDGGSYSEFHVGGSMQAVESSIKIRDLTTVVVGGNLTATSYIELGKAGDYTRTVTQNSDGTYNIVENCSKGITEGTEDVYDDSYKSGESESEGDKTGDGTGAGTDDTSNEEAIVDQATIDTVAEHNLDQSDPALGGQFYVGKVLASYTSYIKEFAYSRVVVGNYVFTPKYLTLRHDSDMWVMPEAFDNETFIKKQYVSTSDGTFWGDVKDRINEFEYNVQQTFTPKNGSIYTLGELTLNQFASLMGTYDCVVQGQCVLRQDSLIYMGHDFNLEAPSLNLSVDAILGKNSVAGFDTYGTASAGGDTTYPVIVYADNEINIMTTMSMKLTYLVANRGDVNLYDIYSDSENAETNAKQLPNAICSYQADINYFAMYGKMGALFYCPNGNLDIDGYYVELWGSGIGDTVSVNTYYLNLHRFSNWDTMELNLADFGKTYLISQEEYESQTNNVDDIFMYNKDSSSSDSTGGASLFFDLN